MKLGIIHDIEGLGMNSRLGTVVLNFNDATTTIKLLSKIEHYTTLDHIVVVDNCSTDDSFQILSDYASSKIDVVKSDKNGGYGYGNNYGIRYLNDKYSPSHILICNPDIDIEEDVLSRMLDVFNNDPEVAVVAPYMLNRDGRKEPGTAWRLPTKYEYIFSAGLLIGHFLRPSYYTDLDKLANMSKEVDCVAGSLLMVDTEKMMEYGMYDEEIFLFGEETTIGSKFKKANLKTVLLLQDTFLHLHGVSINKSIGSEIKKRKLLLKSRQYILKTYLGATRLDLLIAKVVYGVSMLEYRVLLMIRRK